MTSADLRNEYCNAGAADLEGGRTWMSPATAAVSPNVRMLINCYLVTLQGLAKKHARRTKLKNSIAMAWPVSISKVSASSFWEHN